MARTRKLQWVLYPSFLIIIAVSLISVGTYTMISVRNTFLAQIGDSLGMDARLAAELLAVDGAAGGSRMNDIVNTIADSLAVRISVVSLDGRVVADSAHPPGSLVNHSNRPEVASAILTGRGRAIRRSDTDRTEVMYHAVTDSRLRGYVVRAARPVDDAARTLGDLAVKMLIGGLLAAVLAALVSWLASRRLARPVEKMASEVDRQAGGVLADRIEEPDVEEYSKLAAAMNALSETLQARLAASTIQQRELELTLSSMNEAVLLLDSADRIRLINSAGAKLLKIDRDAAVGRAIGDVLSSGALRGFVSRAFDSREPCEQDIPVEGDKPGFVHAFKTVILDGDGNFSATLLVLHDITRLKRLEDIRRDFVANVSHELKTPITSIKGFVETLRSDASHDQATVDRFLEIIARHTDRLNSIIEDLLTLSRIEQAESAGERSREQDPGLAREKVLVGAMVESALLVCESRAARKGILLKVSCEADAVAFLNQQLMEQALVNLVDNAVKFSESGQEVSISADVDHGRLRLRVTDHGCGIPAEHLPRIFERFYRVDKGRSRAQGGTGLGLAIVRHVATIHGGKVRVVSEPGNGSEFVIDVPASPQPG